MPPTMRSRATSRPERGTITAENTPKLSCRARNDESWNKYKEDIRRVYIEQDKSLKETMELIELTASERKWKEKLKEWGFQKNLHATDMAILLSKRDKRLLDGEKDTTFFQNGVKIPVAKFENFKRRKTTNLAQPTSPSAETPPNITYHTPGPNPETPCAEVTDGNASPPSNNSVPTLNFYQSGKDVAWTESRTNEQTLYQSSKLLHSQEANKDRPAPHHSLATAVVDEIHESPFQFSPSTSIPQHIAWGMSPPVMIQNGYESPRYNSASPRNRIFDSPDSSDVTNKYRPVALMSSTSVLAPIAVGRDPLFVVPDIDSRNLDEIENDAAAADSASIHLILAQNYGAYGFTALAESQYMTAIVKCLKLRKKQGVRSCLHEIGMFLKQDRTSKELESSISTCRKLVQLFEQDPLSTGGMKTTSLIMLADLLDRNGQLLEAEVIYKRVIDFTKESGDSDTRCLCESSLAKILYRLWSPNEGAVRQQLQEFSIILSRETCEANLRSAMVAVVTLATPFSPMSSTHPCYPLGSVIKQISDVLGKRIWNRASMFDVRIRSLTMKLASECSALSWKSDSEALFRTQAALLDRLETSTWGYVKIRGYIDCCSYLQRQGDWEKYMEMIMTAYKTLEDLLYSRSVQLFRTGDLPLLELLKATRVRMPTKSCSQALIQIVDGVETRLEKMIAWNQASCIGSMKRHVKNDKEGGEEVGYGNCEGIYEESDGENNDHSEEGALQT